jgi:hypothetical protein
MLLDNWWPLDVIHSLIVIFEMTILFDPPRSLVALAAAALLAR